MKPILRRAAALVLCAALLIPTALASDALGSTIYDYTLDICDGTTLTREVMWSASKSDLRTENYVTYTLRQHLPRGELRHLGGEQAVRGRHG